MDHTVSREVVVTSSAAPFQQAIEAGPHRFFADEPAEQGGTDTGPTPYNLLLSALGSCTAMTLTVYARRKQWPLERVVVRLTHARVYAEDCAKCEDVTRHLERIEREITLEGPLSADQRARLMGIADKCPVHKTLTGTLEIRSRLVE